MHYHDLWLAIIWMRLHNPIILHHLLTWGNPGELVWREIKLANIEVTRREFLVRKRLLFCWLVDIMVHTTGSQKKSCKSGFFPKTPYHILKASLKHLARTRDTVVWAQIRAKMSHMCTIRSFPKLEKQQLDVSWYYNTLLKIQKMFLWVDPENQRCWATSPNWSKNALFMPNVTFF